MKVLYLAPLPKKKGPLTAYSFLDEEITALASAGIRAYVLSRRTKVIQEDRGVVRWPLPREQSFGARGRTMGFLLRSSMSVPPANLLSFGQWYDTARTERIATDVVRREKIDVVHSHFAWPDGLGGSLVRRMTGVPLVACLRGADVLLDPEIGYGARKRPYFDRNLRHLLRAADRTLYFSDFMKDAATQLGADPGRAQVVDKAVDLSHFGVIEDRAGARRQLGFGDRPMILTVGALIPRKGIDVILEALARLRQSYDFTYVVCGEGPEREALLALARRLSLEDRTRFVGRVSRDDIPKFFGACEIFVLASVLEAAGNVLFEAMGSARPIVCTAAGGPGEYVEDGVTGYVVPVRDSAALAERIGALLADPGLADRLGQQGLRHARTKYSYPRLVRDIVGVYEQVLDARHATGRARARFA
jgi:glycosyltransferase involved in cell wall biosynthesis